MINTQTQIDSLIDLAVLQRTELKQLVDSLPQLRDHLSSEIERNLEEIEPAIRSELEQFVAARALDTQAKTSAELSAKLDAMARNLESTTAAKYSVLMAERAQNATLLAQAEARIAEAASALPGAVKGIVTDELARFPRAGEIDQLRKEFAEPRGLNPRGRWQVGETYNKLDLVSYNGDSYVSNTNGNREKPSRSSEAWTLSAARGNGGAGGGVTSLTDLVAVPANGELLIGNGSAFVNSTLTAGTGVTITNGPGTITIDASGAQEILTATVTNAESFAITRGQVVYLFGATGNRASVKLADNSNDAASSKTFGVVSEASIAAGANGLITCVGTVDKLALGSYTEGDVLYLGATPGAVTNVKPYAPNHLVYVGMVERANNGNGELYVRIQNGFELDEIHDVQITSAPLAGALLMRDATNSLWKANRLTGTANQVTVTNADTSVTLSLPTAIANVNSVTAATTQNLTLAGGSTGASLVLGQGASGNLVMSANSAERARLTSTGNLLIGTTESAHGYRMFASNQTDNAYIAVSNQSGAAGTRSLRMGFASAATTATIQGTRVGVADDINVAIQAGGGNLLIGTTTDSGNGKLQLATHTTSAGGIGFGTDNQLFRYGSSQLALTNSSGTSGSAIASNMQLRVENSGNGGIQVNVPDASTGGVYFGRSTDAYYAGIERSGTNLQLRNAGATALTLASTGAATFAGNIIVAQNSFTNFDGSGAARMGMQSVSVSPYSVRMLGSADSVNTRDFSFGYYTGDNSANAWNQKAAINSYTGAANFAGTVSVGGASAGTAQAEFRATSATTNAPIPVIGLEAMSSGTAIDGFGPAIDFRAENLAGTGPTIAGRIATVFKNTGYSNQEGEMSLWTASNSTLYRQLTLSPGSGAAGASTFAGAVSVNSVTPSTGAGSGALQVAGGIYAGANSYFTGQITSVRPFMATGSIAANMTSAGGIGFAGGGANVFSFGANASTTGAFTVQLVSSNASLNFNALTIAANTGAATFAGAVAINNTVAAAAGVASTHKVTMVIGGVTYYLLASNV